MTVFEFVSTMLEEKQPIIVERYNGYNGNLYHSITNEIFIGTAGEYIGNSETKTEIENRSREYNHSNSRENRLSSRNYPIFKMIVEDDYLVIFIKDIAGDLKNV